EPPRHEPGLSLRSVPAPEVLDHGLRVDGRERVGGELPHRRRPAEPARAGLELFENLSVAVALAQARLELGQDVRVDPARGRRSGFPGHGNKDRANWGDRKCARAGMARESEAAALDAG